MRMNDLPRQRRMKAMNWETNEVHDLGNCFFDCVQKPFPADDCRLLISTAAVSKRVFEEEAIAARSKSGYETSSPERS